MIDRICVRRITTDQTPGAEAVIRTPHSDLWLHTADEALIDMLPDAVPTNELILDTIRCSRGNIESIRIYPDMRLVELRTAICNVYLHTRHMVALRDAVRSRTPHACVTAVCPCSDKRPADKERG